MHIFRISSVVVLFLVHTNMSLASSPTVQFYGELDSPCHPLSLITCALPYPSDIYAHADANSETGLRLTYPAGIIPEYLLEDIPSSLTPQSVFNDSNGFSAATSVLFEIREAPDQSTLPIDGGNTVIAFNLETGERVPLRVRYNNYAQSTRVAAPSHVIEIHPRSRWTFSDRYVVVLTNALEPSSGSPLEPSVGVLKAISADNSKLSNYYEPIVAFLEEQGLARSDLIDLTFFTVRSEAEVTSPITSLSRYVYEDVYVHDFRNNNGGMDYDLTHVQGHWIGFHLVLPRKAKDQQVPIAIYGHGLSLLKESDASIARTNADLGIATVSIDHPNHGSRIFYDGGYVLARLEPAYVPMLSGMIIQSSVDFMSLLKAITTSIGAIDVLPKRSWNLFVSTPRYNGDGIPEIDTNNIFYQGTSLGGVLGSTFIALAPNLTGAFLQVTGVGVTNILSNSLLWEGVFSHMMPSRASGAEAMLLKSAMQHDVDYGDAINFVHYFRHPPNTSTAKPVAIVAGLDDGVVPNFSTAAMAEIAQIPQVGEILFPIYGVNQTDVFEDGYGVMQVKPLLDIRGGLRGIFAHLSSSGSEMKTIMKQWIQEVILDK